MKAIQHGIVALIAVCWALTGCGGEAEDTVEEFGQAEQAVVRAAYHDNFQIMVCIKGSDNRPANASEMGSFPNGAATIGTSGLDTLLESARNSLFNLPSPAAGAGGSMIGMDCEPSVPFPANPSIANSKVDVILDTPIDVSSGDCVGQAICSTASDHDLVTSQPQFGNYTQLRSVTLRINRTESNRLVAVLGGGETNRERIRQWVTCRLVGRILGLANAPGQNTCMGSHPTSVADWNNKRTFNSSENTEYRQFMADSIVRQGSGFLDER